MKILNKIIKTFLTIGVLVILPIVVFTFITSKTTTFGLQSFVVLTGSMQPTIPVGSVVYTQKQNSYQKGDVIAFKSGNVNVTHRITNINYDGSFQTRGDANNTPDSKGVSPNTVLGREVLFLPFVGKIITLLKTPKGFFPIVVFPAIVFIVLEFWNLKHEIEREVRRKLEKETNANAMFRVREL